MLGLRQLGLCIEIRRTAPEIMQRRLKAVTTQPAIHLLCLMRLFGVRSYPLDPLYGSAKQEGTSRGVTII